MKGIWAHWHALIPLNVQFVTHDLPSCMAARCAFVFHACHAVGAVPKPTSKAPGTTASNCQPPAASRLPLGRPRPTTSRQPPTNSSNSALARFRPAGSGTAPCSCCRPHAAAIATELLNYCTYVTKEASATQMAVSRAVNAGHTKRIAQRLSNQSEATLHSELVHSEAL